jgi:hypothetical protein
MKAPESVAREFAQKSSTVLVLKGQNTYIATPEGSIFKSEAGSRALGKKNFLNCIEYHTIYSIQNHGQLNFFYSVTCFFIYRMMNVNINDPF